MTPLLSLSLVAIAVCTVVIVATVRIVADTFTLHLTDEEIVEALAEGFERGEC